MAIYKIKLLMSSHNLIDKNFAFTFIDFIEIYTNLISTKFFIDMENLMEIFE